MMITLATERLVLILSHLMGFKHDTSLSKVLHPGVFNPSLSPYHYSTEIQTEEESSNLMLQFPNNSYEIGVFPSK